MASFQDLVDVTFQDATARVAISGGDVLGIVLPWYWGPTGKRTICNMQEFYELYPEDVNRTFTDADEPLLKQYALIKDYFANGGSTVEVYSPQCQKRFFYEIDVWGIALKYDGAIPLSLLPSGTTEVTITVDSRDSLYIAELKAGNIIIESLQFQVDDPRATYLGESTYVEDVLSKSQFLTYMESSPDNAQQVDQGITNLATPFVPSQVSLATEYTKVFGDVNTSVATQLLAWEDDLVAIKTISDSRKDITFMTPYKSTQQVDSMWGVAVNGMTKIKVSGVYRTISCMGGVAGATAKVARQVRLNQLASARVYGTYQGTLTEDISFNDVLTLSDKGVISVYNSNNGPQIFGVRNSLAASKPNSYFSKFNVSRVIAAILRNIYPVVLDAIHSDTASNPISMAIFDTQLNSVIDTFVSQQNIGAGSRAVADSSINTPKTTQGGTLLNALLEIEFFGLVERVSIKVVATDSSVTAEII